ncbi:MAG: flagellar M-ring protein FliF [Bradymonadia bacterium]|jgi:flagellar M-ring protein FliF
MERLSQFASQLRTTFTGLPVSQRAGIGVAVLLTVAAMAWIMTSASRIPQRVLFAGLEPERSARVLEALDARGIPYELRGPGTITVSEDQLYAARIHLAGEGVSNPEGAGFELFDDAEFGMTAFTQRVNYQRAMENELARTVRHIEAVRSARVHLVLPEDALFEEDQEEPSASVVLTLERGVPPSEGEIESIRFLVASAVEGMAPGGVTIVDSMGRTLARPNEGGGMSGSSDALEAARGVETELEERIVSILEPVVGARRIRASVRVELDTSERVETVEEFDPEGVAVRNEQRSQETSSRTEAAGGGAAGAVANLPAGAPGAGGAAGQEDTGRTEETLSYEINTVVRQRVQNGYTVERLTVAVLIDAAGPAASAPIAVEGEPVEGEAAPPARGAVVMNWTPEQLAQLTSLVENVVGFDGERGDRVMIMQESFVAEPVLATSDVPPWLTPDLFVPVLRYGVLFFGILMLAVLVVRPVMRSLLTVPTTEPATQMIVRTVAELESDMQNGGIRVRSFEDEAEYDKLRAEVMSLTDQDVDRASEVITEWIRVDAA